jgi:hypothetical protein
MSQRSEHERERPPPAVSGGYKAVPLPVRIIRRLKAQNALAAELTQTLEQQVTDLEVRLVAVEDQLQAAADDLRRLDEEATP